MVESNQEDSHRQPLVSIHMHRQLHTHRPLPKGSTQARIPDRCRVFSDAHTGACDTLPSLGDSGSSIVLQTPRGKVTELSQASSCRVPAQSSVLTYHGVIFPLLVRSPEVWNPSIVFPANHQCPPSLKHSPDTQRVTFFAILMAITV